MDDLNLGALTDAIVPYPAKVVDEHGVALADETLAEAVRKLGPLPVIEWWMPAGEVTVMTRGGWRELEAYEPRAGVAVSGWIVQVVAPGCRIIVEESSGAE